MRKWVVFVGAAVVVAFSTILIFLPEETPISPTIQAVLSGLPVRLTIPAISVDAVVESVGLTPEGAMDAPKGPSEVGWYKLGPRPGEIGSAVIDGHFGWKDGIAAVFDDLHALKKGDKIYVEDSTGTTITFIVREKRLYNPNTDASSVFISNDGQAHLNLVTCEGVWNPASKNYSERLVIFADKE